MRLRRRNRVDGLQNDVRAAQPKKLRQQWGRLVYLSLLGVFVAWVIDIFLGDLLYFNVDGLVVQDRIVLATQYDASVVSVNTNEGERVHNGDVIIELKSQAVEENIAELSADIARLMERASALQVRKQVVEATSQVAEARAQEAIRARQELEDNPHLFTTRDRLARIEAVAESVEAQSEARAERQVIERDLPELQKALAIAQQALERLITTYANGTLSVPANGVVGYLNVSPGSVVKNGAPLMEIFTGEPHVLAYIPEGALYEVAVGDAVAVDVGFRSYEGTITQLYPVTATLPKEYSDALRVPKRAPLARIDFDDTDAALPSLFAQTEISAVGIPPAWIKRLFGFSAQSNLVAADQASPTPVIDPPRQEVGQAVDAPAISPTVETQAVKAEAPETPEGEQFTVQLLALTDLDRVQEFIRKTDELTLNLRVLEKPDATYYVALSGGFATREHAAEHARALEKQGHTGWVRPLSGLAVLQQKHYIARK